MLPLESLLIFQTEFRCRDFIVTYCTFSIVYGNTIKRFTLKSNIAAYLNYFSLNLSAQVQKNMISDTRKV